MDVCDRIGFLDILRKYHNSIKTESHNRAIFQRATIVQCEHTIHWNYLKFWNKKPQDREGFSRSLEGISKRQIYCMLVVEFIQLISPHLSESIFPQQVN